MMVYKLTIMDDNKVRLDILEHAPQREPGPPITFPDKAQTFNPATVEAALQMLTDNLLPGKVLVIQ